MNDSYFFHLGALDSNYVKISKLHKANKKQITQLEKENDKYRTVLEALQAGINGAQMSFDSQSLERAIISRQVEIKRILAVGFQHALDALLHPEGLRTGHGQPVAQGCGGLQKQLFVHDVSSILVGCSVGTV